MRFLIAFSMFVLPSLAIISYVREIVLDNIENITESLQTDINIISVSAFFLICFVFSMLKVIFDNQQKILKKIK